MSNPIAPNRPHIPAVDHLRHAPPQGPTPVQKKAFIATSVVLAALGLGAIVTATLLKGNASSIDRIRLGCYVGGGLFLGLVFVGGHVVACYTRPVAARANPLPRRRAEEERAAGTQRAETLDRSQRHAAAGQFSQNQKELRQTHQQHVARAEAVSPISAPIPIALQPALVATPLPAPQPPIAAQATTAQQLPVSRPKPAPTPAVVLGAEGSLSVENACALISHQIQLFDAPRQAAIKAIAARVPKQSHEALGKQLAAALFNKGDISELLRESWVTKSLRRGLLSQSEPWIGATPPGENERFVLTAAASDCIYTIFATSSSEKEALALEILLHEKWNRTTANSAAREGYLSSKCSADKTKTAPLNSIISFCTTVVNATHLIEGIRPEKLIHILQNSSPLSDDIAHTLIYSVNRILITDTARRDVLAEILFCAFESIMSAKKKSLALSALLFFNQGDKRELLKNALEELPHNRAHQLRTLLSNRSLGMAQMPSESGSEAR